MAVGRVDDLDALIATFDPESDQEIMARLNQKRDKHYQYMIRLLNSKRYRVFMDDLEKFLTTEGRGTQRVKYDTIPTQVRHVLPVMIYQHLADVKAFDVLVDDERSFKFHVLTLRVKRLRLLIERFEPVLGTSAQDYLQAVIQLQDYLEQVMDAKLAYRHLASVIKKQDKLNKKHLKHAKKQVLVLKDGFGEVWQTFNLRRVQQKLSTAILTLR
jgi:CHAD domain-containing protein